MHYPYNHHRKLVVMENHMNLIKAMKKALPLYAKPSKYLLNEFREMRPSDNLKITDVHYLGNEGGISCAIMKDDTVMIISLTHLIFEDNQPLVNEINAYKRNRIHMLKMQNTAVSDNLTGRNMPCPCGSGKKYKHCCGR